MKTQLPSKYPWKSSREHLRVREPQVENHCSQFHIFIFHSIFTRTFGIMGCKIWCNFILLWVAR